MSKVILKDKTEIQTVSLPSLAAVKTRAADLAAAEALKEKLTPENISEVTTTNDAGLEVGHYKDLVLATLTADLLSADGVDVTIGLRDKTDMEKLRDEYHADKAVTDGAIADLGEAVSEMAEGGNA